jgi:O-antigen ligase
MIVVATIAALAALLWAVILAPRISKVPNVALLLGLIVTGYVFSYELWRADVGPLPLTLDRLLLLGVATLFAWRIWRGETRLTTPCGADWAILLVLAWLTASCLLNRPGDGLVRPSSPMFRLVVSFWIPAFLYGLMRHERFTESSARWLMTGLALLGGYLAITALCETFGIWSLVFPRYIANPDLGLHFGRARGPALNSVSLGVYLGVGATAAWLLIPRANRPMQLVWFTLVALMSLGVLLTFTRSTWIGLAGAVVTVIVLQLPKRFRMPAFVSVLVLAVAFLAVGKDALIALKRDNMAGSSAHSVQQRTAFAYVSMQMFADHPLWGVGFGRFYDQKLPYLTDRRQSFELESLRDLEHHNTFLSLLTETGMVGLLAYLAVLAAWTRYAWRLAHDPTTSGDCQRLGLLALGTIAVYLPSAVFHDLTLVHSDQWLLYSVAGAATGCWINHHATASATVPNPTTAAPSGALVS